MSRFKTYLLFLFVVIFNMMLLAETTGVELTEEQWEELSEGKDYTETFKEKEPEKDKENPFDEFDTPKPLNYNLEGFKYVFYFLVLGLVVFLIIKIIVNFNKNPSISKKTISIDSIEEIEEKMHEIDLEELLADALKAGNYRIALRINFLIIIKLLSQKNEIIWAKEKTNWEYYDEVKHEEIKGLFKNIIISFEPVWYGEHNLSQEQFNLVSPSYEHLKKQLTPNE